MRAVIERGSLRSEEETSGDKLVGLALHGVDVTGKARAGRDGAVVCARRVEAIERGPDREDVVHNGVDSKRLCLLDLRKRGSCL